jgi:PPK2 family polyphosphate:nucleotide phosphotransferase
MPAVDDLIDTFRVRPDQKIKLKDFNPRWAGNPEVPKDDRKRLAQEIMTKEVTDLAESQERLYASDTWSVLIILQAMDAAGKDSTIKHVMSGINPQGCQVFSFKHPSAEELDHNFLWRYSKALPERGRIGLFNRSYYEEVLVVRVHPEILAAQRIPNLPGDGDEVWQDRFEDINAFEKHLSRNGTKILKFFLHLSRDEQLKRFLKRLEDPKKQWKFSAADLAEREHWDSYQHAFEEMISATSTRWAPWYVVPADHKWVSRALVAAVISREIEKLDLAYPELSAAQKAELKAIEESLKKQIKKS